MTLVIFSGDAIAARVFAREAGMDLSQTILLPDPTMQITALYRADPCPRVFVVGPDGTIDYTNNHPDDAPRTASGDAIAARALMVLQASRRLPKE